MENNEQAYQLKKLVMEMTTSGKDKLDEEQFKKVKKICKQSDIYVIELYRLISKQLNKNHAEIRFSAFQICDEIFCRSHCFRNLVLKDFMTIVDLTLGLNPDKPMPKPLPVAKKLKQKCVETIQRWHDKYSEGYIMLQRAYMFLRDCKRVDFAELTARTETERQRAEEERQRTEELKRKKIEKVTNEFKEHSPEIKDYLLQFQNCFKLLIPDVHDFFIPLDDKDLVTEEGGGFMPSDEVDDEINEDIYEFGSETMRGHGLMQGTSVQIDLDKVKTVNETKDNMDVIQNLKDLIHVFNSKLLPLVRKWEQTMQPYLEGNGRLIKHIVEQKQFIQSAVSKFESLDIMPLMKPSTGTSVDYNSDDDDDDDDFVEVPFDDPRVVRAAESEAALLGITSSKNYIAVQLDDPYNQPSTSGTSSHSQENNKIDDLEITSLATSSSQRNKNKKTQDDIRCPDDYRYLNKNDITPRRHHNPLAGLSQVWTATADLHEQDEVNSTGGIMGVATQRVNYERTWEPVKDTCRAPLPTGRLCPRKDREKCPLHGPIIPRDDSGVPLKPEDIAREKAKREQYERDHPAWQDPQLLAELKAATGVDLKVTKGRRKRPKYENLTDIKKTTPRERLAKKVMSRKAMRRMNAAFANEHRSAPNVSADFRFGQS